MSRTSPWVLALGACLFACGGREAAIGRARPSDGVDAGSGGSMGAGVAGGASGSPGSATGGGTDTDAASGVAGAGVGGTNLGAAGSSGSGPDAGNPFETPIDRERRELASRYCATCAGGNPDCVAEWDILWYRDTPRVCWDDLVATVSCAIDNVRCEALDDVDGPCRDARLALELCEYNEHPRGEITGTRTTCNWRLNYDGNSCIFICNEPSERQFSGDCIGPPGGPFQCDCYLNLRLLVDEFVMNRHRFIAADCEAAGQRMADGYCQDVVNCCFEYFGSRATGVPEQNLCICTSDPAAGGFESCEAAAADRSGHVVGLCPAYLPFDRAP